MIKPRMAALLMIAVMPSRGAWAQSGDEETRKVALETAKLSNEKARLAGLDALRSTSGGSSTFTNADKSAEGLILRNAIYAGLAGRLAANLALEGYSPPSKDRLRPDPMPLLVLGSTPPTIAQWLSFESQSRHLQRDLESAVMQWDQASTTSCAPTSASKIGAGGGAGTLDTSRFSAFLGVLAPVLLSTGISAAATTYSFTGGTITASPTDAETEIGKALQRSNYAVDLEAFRPNTTGGGPTPRTCWRPSCRPTRSPGGASPRASPNASPRLAARRRR